MHALTGLRPWAAFFAFCCALVAFPAVLHAQSLPNYQLVETFQLPGVGGPIGVTPDGRILTVVGRNVYQETSPGSKSFATLGQIPAGEASPTGPAFVRVSPNGTLVAIGNAGGASGVNQRVGVLSLPALTGTWFSVEHNDAAWLDNRYLALSGATAGEVVALDSASPSATEPIVPTIVDNLGGAPGGLALGAAGRLFVGNAGASGGPSETGAIKAFAQSAWSLALSGGAPVDFENSGTLVAELLTAVPLQFDQFGNLLVGDGFGPTGQVAIVASSAVASALAGSGKVDETSPSLVHWFDPQPTVSNGTLLVTANPARQEFYVQDPNSTTSSAVYVYRVANGTPVPAAGGLWPSLLTALLLLVGVGRARLVTVVRARARELA